MFDVTTLKLFNLILDQDSIAFLYILRNSFFKGQLLIFEYFIVMNLSDNEQEIASYL